MLAAITLTMNQCTKQDMATPAALALQGLQELHLLGRGVLLQRCDDLISRDETGRLSEVK